MSSDLFQNEKSKPNLQINLLPLTDPDAKQTLQKKGLISEEQQGSNTLHVPIERQYDDIMVFRSATEKGLKFNNLEQAFKPIFSTIKTFITDYTSKLGLRQSDLARNEQANSCLIVSRYSQLHFGQIINMEYNKLMEYQCYDLMRVVLEFVLTDECEIAFQLKPNKTKKFKSQMYISKLKDHFKAKRKGSLHNLFNKLSQVEKSNKLNYFADDSDEEGFFDAISVRDDSLTDTARSLKLKNSLKMEFFDSDMNFHQGGGVSSGKVKELDEKIKELELQIKSRDEYIQGLTSGYIKDVSHMKEMIFRKQNIDEIEFYEVQYFDGTQNLDEQTRLALNDKLRTLKQNFELKTREYVKKILFLSTEYEKIKKQYSQIQMNKGDTMEMFKRIFECQENPYLLWKQIQETKGNKFFFDVFERQRPEYGINYKEVNQMLMSKRAYEKEYSYYKEQTDDSLCNLIKKCSDEIEEIRNELIDKDNLILELKSQQKEHNLKKQDKMIANMKTYLEQKEADIYAKFENQKMEQMNENEDQDKHILKSILFRWCCINKIIKCKNLNDNRLLMEQIKDLLINNPYQNDIVKKYEAKIKEIEEDNKKVESKYDVMNLQIIYEKTEKEEILSEKTVLLEEIINLKSQIAQLREETKNKENQSLLYQNILNNIYKHIGLKIDDSQFEHVNLDDEKKTSTKAFKKKMTKIDKQSLRRLREEQILGEKVVEAHAETFQSVSTQTQGTITDLLNVDLGIVYQNTIDKQIRSQKKEIADQFQAQFENLQNEMQNELLTQQKAFQEEISRIKQNPQSRSHSRKTSTRKSEIIQQSVQTQSKSSIQDSELADEIDQDMISQTNLKNFPNAAQQQRKSFFLQALGTMGLDKEDQEIQTENTFIVEFEQTIEKQSKQMEILQEDNTKLITEIANLQQEILKQKEKIIMVSDQQLQNRGSFLMTPQKTLKSDHRLKENDDQTHLNLISDMIQEYPQTNNNMADNLSNASPDSTEHRLTSQFTQKKSLITNKEGLVIKRDASKPIKSKKKKVFDRLFQDSKDKANRLELLKKHLDQMESFQWEEILSMLNLYSKEPEQNNEEALYLLQQKLLQEKIVPYAERNQAMTREKQLKDFVLNQQLSSISSPGEQSLNQSTYMLNKINKQQKALTRAEYFYKKQQPCIPQSANNNDGNAIVNRRQSSSPQTQKECDYNIVDAFQELNQENYEKKKQYMDQLYDNFKKHNNRIKSSLQTQTTSNNTSQDEQQMKVYFLDKNKRFSNGGRIATQETKGLSFYDTQKRRSLYTTTSSSQSKRPNPLNLDDSLTQKNSKLMNTAHSRTSSQESPRTIFYSNSKRIALNSSQESKRITTKRTVINTEKILKLKDDQRIGQDKIAEKVEKLKDQIKNSIVTNSSVFIPDSIYSIIKGKNVQIPQQNNDSATLYSHHVDLQTIDQ